MLLAVIWGLAWSFEATFLKRDLEHLLSVQQFSAVSVVAASIEQETRLRLKTLADLARSSRLGRFRRRSGKNRRLFSE
jgi:hypothetical protein